MVGGRWRRSLHKERRNDSVYGRRKVIFEVDAMVLVFTMSSAVDLCLGCVLG